ncbi:MAG: hypothetical protein OXC25_05320 [Thiotrichales bacterium]|nr:hypothetical protein [Thiotrichales bacterium]
MSWVQTATLIVSIVAAVAAGTGVIVLSVNGTHSQVAALQTQATADRGGMAQRMTRNRAPAAAVMRQGRWSSVRMVARYTRHQIAAEALDYL